jgi:hypothetical protein
MAADGVARAPAALKMQPQISQMAQIMSGYRRLGGKEW